MTRPRSPYAQLDVRLERFASRLRVPGAGLAVIDADGTVDAAITGTTRRGHNEPAVLCHQWHVGSCAKSITAAIYALLVQRGRARVLSGSASFAHDLHAH